MDIRQSRRRLIKWLDEQASGDVSDTRANLAIGRDAGVSAEMVRKWRQQENWPGAESLFRLAHKRGLNLNWLAGTE